MPWNETFLIALAAERSNSSFDVFLIFSDIPGCYSENLIIDFIFPAEDMVSPIVSVYPISIFDILVPAVSEL